MKRLISVGNSILFLAALGFAHGNEQHVIGVVSAVTQDSIIVETLNKQKVTVRIGPDTRFEKGSEAAALKDVKTGDRVAIHAAKQGDRLQAHTVRIGTTPAAAEHHHKAQ